MRFFWLFLISGVLLQSADFKNVSYQDKLTDSDLLFCVTFDKGHVNADFAKGEPWSTTLKDVNLHLRGITGFDSMPAYRPEAGENLKYRLPGNVNLREGALSIWFAALDYYPSLELIDGEKRNIALAQLRFASQTEHIDFLLYRYGNEIYLQWLSSTPPHGWGQDAKLRISCKNFKQSQFHQLVFSWKEEALALYLDGEKTGETVLPAKYANTASLELDPEKSFIGIKNQFYGDRHLHATAVDDVKIYSRALTALEIARNYQLLRTDIPDQEQIPPYAIELYGVDLGNHDPIDKLEAEFDFSGLDNDRKKLLENGKLILIGELSKPNGQRIACNIPLQSLQQSHIFTGIDVPGLYTLNTDLDGIKASASIVRPDFSWIGNQLGEEDQVPEIFGKFELNGRTVHLWNRTYHFGTGPLPERITAYERNILKSPPQVQIDQQNIRWTAGKTSRNQSTILLTGTGTATDFTIEYQTTIEFDGLIRCYYSIHGSPEIATMKLHWQMEPGLCEYLLTPLLQENEENKFAFTYPYTSWETTSMLFLASEGRGGFVYSMQNDANWVYDPEEPVFLVDKNSGNCEVRMITRKVTVPENTSYEALFIATPTRPFPEKIRLIRHNEGNGPLNSCGSGFVNGAGKDGFEGCFSTAPVSKAFTERMKRWCKPYSGAVYSAANGVTTQEEHAMYLRKYTEIPGSYSYKMPYWKYAENGVDFVQEYQNTFAVCNKSFYNDYMLNNLKKLFAHPTSDRIGKIYYDLCGNELCGNPWHGCRFQDKFGRQIKTFTLLAQRELVKRTIRYCHAHGRTVMLHAQRHYNPILHGLADYFYPGEQLRALVEKEPFAYTDRISLSLYRSEYNRNVLGTGIVFLPGYSYFVQKGRPYVIAMMTMLLLHDIDFTPPRVYASEATWLWDIFERYGMGDQKVKVHRYYQQQSVKADHADIKITRYECPENRNLLVIGNPETVAHETSIDVSSITSQDQTAREEFSNFTIPVKDGRFTMQIPPRSFRLVALNPKSFYPYQDSFDRGWAIWKPADSDADGSHNHTSGRTDNYSMCCINKNTGKACLTKKLPANPGNQYLLSLWVKTDKETEVKLGVDFQQDDMQLKIPRKALSSPVKPGSWEKVEVDFLLPDSEQYSECNFFFVTIGIADNNTIAEFDDLEIRERKVNPVR